MRRRVQSNTIHCCLLVKRTVLQGLSFDSAVEEDFLLHHVVFAYVVGGSHGNAQVTIMNLVRQIFVDDIGGIVSNHELQQPAAAKAECQLQ